MEEDPQGFIDEVLKVIDVMDFPSLVKVELPPNNLMI